MYNSSTAFLPQENHPKLTLIKQKQDEVNPAWERLYSLALKRQKTLSDAIDFQRFKRYESCHHSIGSSATAPCLLFVLACVYC